MTKTNTEWNQDYPELYILMSVTLSVDEVFAGRSLDTVLLVAWCLRWSNRMRKCWYALVKKLISHLNTCLKILKKTRYQIYTACLYIDCHKFESEHVSCHLSCGSHSMCLYAVFFPLWALSSHSHFLCFHLYFLSFLSNKVVHCWTESCQACYLEDIRRC